MRNGKAGRRAAIWTVGIAGLTALAVSLAQQPAEAATVTSSHVDRALQARTDSARGASTPDPKASLKAPNSQVAVRADRPAVTITADSSPFSVTLQGNATGSQVSGNKRVYSGLDKATDAAVVTVDANTAKMMVVLNDQSAPTTQRYQLGLPAGAALKPFNGGFLIVQGDKVVGAIRTPWAVDAAGRNLPTQYTVQGSTLIQQTDTTGAKFPVVVDPTITVGFSFYLNMWGWEINYYASLIIGIGGAAGAVGCTLIGKIPNQVLRSIASLICGYGFFNLKLIFQTIVDIWRNTFINPTSCYQMNLRTPARGFSFVSNSNCE